MQQRRAWLCLYLLLSCLAALSGAARPQLELPDVLHLLSKDSQEPADRLSSYQTEEVVTDGEPQKANCSPAYAVLCVEQAYPRPNILCLIAFYLSLLVAPSVLQVIHARWSSVSVKLLRARLTVSVARKRAGSFPISSKLGSGCAVDCCS